METDANNIKDLLAVIRRRRWFILLPAGTVCLAAVLVAFLLPPLFRATSTILIEDQEIPRDYVITTVTGFAEQRLQTINQRIMGATRLLEIINEHDLYRDLRAQKTKEEVVERMRKDIAFETISSDVIDPRTGRATAATIAFSLAYQAEDPATAQKIANVLTSLYLEENLKVRRQQTQGASRFLEEEMGALKNQLQESDARIAVFKQRNLNHLPELAEFNLQVLDRTERDIDQLNSVLQSLREREGYLQAELAGIPAMNENQDRQRLSELRIQLTNLRTRVSERYPDVKKMEAEITALEKRLGNAEGAPLGKPDNPSFITLSAQLASVQAEIKSVRQQIEGFFRKREEYRRRIAGAPQVEEEYKALMAERNNLQVKFDDLTRKYMEARVAQGLEREQMGERFTLIEAARQPEKPVSPNRPAILLIGLILGAGAGAGAAALKEVSDQSVRHAEALSRATQLPVLAGIPEIVTAGDRNLWNRRRLVAQIGMVAVLVAGFVVFHFLIMDLDILWAKIVRRLAA